MTRKAARMHQPRRVRKLLAVPVLIVSLFVGALPAHASNTTSSTWSGKSTTSSKPAGAGSGHRIR